MNQEDYNTCIREIFSILTQGIEVTMYETNTVTKRSSVRKQTIWMDSDIYRICFASTRATYKRISRGKIPHGIFLRDISEVRDGAKAFDFTANQTRPPYPNRCMSIIGSEMTMSLEYPSKTSKEWFLKRFRLLMEDILVDEERSVRAYKIWESFEQDRQLLVDAEITDASKLQVLLVRGIEVLHHSQTGLITNAILLYNTSKDSLELRTKQISSFFGIRTNVSQFIEVSDVAEIRPGSHSLSFIRTKSTPLDNETMSVVGSQNCFDLQFINKTARDMFAKRLTNFIIFRQEKKRSDVTEVGNDVLDDFLVADRGYSNDRANVSLDRAFAKNDRIIQP